MITCTQCKKAKRNSDYFKEYTNGVQKYYPTCPYCRSGGAKVPPPQTSKMHGEYTPPAWNIRAGSDQHLNIRSRGL